jgi:hypothetical protein
VRESFDGLLPRAVDAVLGYAVEARDEAAPTGLLSGQALARAHLDARCKGGDFGKGGGFLGVCEHFSPRARASAVACESRGARFSRRLSRHRPRHTDPTGRATERAPGAAQSTGGVGWRADREGRDDRSAYRVGAARAA